MNNQEKKLYTPEEIKKVAPGYKGEPNSFDPTKIGQKRLGKPKGKAGPATAVVTPPTALDKAKKPTPPKNSPLWAYSIFGIDVSVRELQVNQEITPSFARLPELVAEVYSSSGGDDQNLNKQMTKGMLMYYNTALLWARLLDIKAKRGNTNLNFEENEFCKAMTQQEYNIPQPIYLFLIGIGEVIDVTGKTVHLANHRLPVTVSQGQGGYHSAVIDADSHCLNEEIPSLGICGDVVMAESSKAAAPPLDFRVTPPHTRATRSLVGNFGAIGARKEEVRILLHSVGVTALGFDETIVTTHYNYFVGCQTFRNEKVKLDALTIEGDVAQLIRSIPTDENVDEACNRPTSATANTITTFGASYVTNKSVRL